MQIRQKSLKLGDGNMINSISQCVPSCMYFVAKCDEHTLFFFAHFLTFIQTNLKCVFKWPEFSIKFTRKKKEGVQNAIRFKLLRWKKKWT